MTARLSIGGLLDSLGVEMELGEHQQITEVVVIAKVVDFADDDGIPALAIGWGKGADWIARRGLITAGLWMMDESGACVCDDE